MTSLSLTDPPTPLSIQSGGFWTSWTMYVWPIYLLKKKPSSYQACPPSFSVISQAFWSPEKSPWLAFHYQTCLCHVHSLNVGLTTEKSPDCLPDLSCHSSLSPYPSGDKSLALHPHTISDASFLPVFWWFFHSSLNWLCPLTTGHHCFSPSSQHFLSLHFIWREHHCRDRLKYSII